MGKLLMLTDEAFQMIAAEAEQADWDEAIHAAFSNPTVASLTELLSFPQRVEKIEQSWNAYIPGQQRRNMIDAAKLANALNGGHVKIAEEMLRERAEALRKGIVIRQPLASSNTRTPPENPAHTVQMIRALKSGEPRRINEVRAFAGMVLAFGADPEEAPALLERAGFDRGRARPDRSPAGQPSITENLLEMGG
jgi:hypothetical protein